MAILFAAAQPTGATDEEVEIPLWATGAAAAAGAALCYAPPVLAYSVLFGGLQDDTVLIKLFGLTAVSAAGVCGTLAATFLPTSYGAPPNIAAGIGSGVGSLVGLAAAVPAALALTRNPPFNTTATGSATVAGGVGLGMVAGAFAGASLGVLAGDALE